MALKKDLRTTLILALSVIMISQLASAGPEMETIATTVEVTNVAPTVGTVTPTSPVVLSEHTTVVVACSATVTDQNGWEDVTSVNGTFYLVSVGLGCTPNDANCYVNVTCALSGGSGTTVTATCNYAVKWYAQASTDEGNWRCAITAIDSVVHKATNSSITTVSDLVALDITAPLAFGTMIVGQTSASDKTVNVTNTGNVRIDLNVNGTAMTCTSGSIAASYLHYNMSESIAYASMSALTGTAADTKEPLKTGFNLAEGAAQMDNTYWKINIPAGVTGTCSGALTVTALKG